MRKATVLLIYLLFLALGVNYLSSCKSGVADDNVDLQRVWALAQDNKGELQNVLAHYSKKPADSLKLKAALFLIQNMPGHFSYEGAVLERFDEIFDIIAKKEAVRPLPGNIHFAEIDASWDSIARLYGPLDVNALNRVEDCRVIKADLLIENIDLAFRAWQLPWSKHLTFDEFCEYILPYRFENERLESWRSLFMEKYSWLADSMKGSTDPVKACELVNNDIKKWLRFNEIFNRYPSAICAKNLLKCKMGKCLDQAAIANFAMRAMGIPVAHEFVPQWAERSMGHDFSSVLSKSGTFIDFLGGELAPGKNEIRNIAPKIYREMYSIQHGQYLTQVEEDDVPFHLKNPFIKDVTKDYLSTTDLAVAVNGRRDSDSRFAYLCVFNNNEWIPVAEAKVVNGQSHFLDVGRNAVYLPGYFVEGKVIPAAEPIIVGRDGGVKRISVNGQRFETAKLLRKYPLNGVKIWWLTWMGSGEFQGANRESFSDAKTLFVVPDTIQMRMNTSALSTSSKYRYVRFLFPDNNNGSLGEIAFYGDLNRLVPLQGRRIRSKKVDSLDAEIAFDNKFDVFIHRADETEYNGEWIGLDLGTSQKIVAVGYSPRNDRNGIFKGMEYELFYWDNMWKSLGKRIPEHDDELEFHKVPVGALLWLRNLTEGVEERIFLFEKGKQIWW